MIPFAGDVASLVLDYVGEKRKTEENIEFTRQQFADLMEADLYGDFRFHAVITQYNTSNKMETVVDMSEGYDTIERINRVNAGCDTQITLEEMLINPKSVWDKLSKNEIAYDNALAGD